MHVSVSHFRVLSDNTNFIMTREENWSEINVPILRYLIHASQVSLLIWSSVQPPACLTIIKSGGGNVFC